MRPCNRFTLKKAAFREVCGLRSLPATEVRVELSVEENERCEYEAFPSYRQSFAFHPRLILDGETTRRISLNLDRGSGALDAQHGVRKREPQRETVKSRSQQDGSEGHICVIV
jgi:hypothetical protein